MSQDILKEAEARMKRTMETLQGELSKLRTGRAHPSLIEHIKVESYGAMVPLKQVANIHVVDARTLSVVPWDKKSTIAIERAISAADLGLNPVARNDGLHIPLPPLNEERRRELGKIVKQEAEQARVAVRNIRRDANQDAKNRLKAKTMTEDEEKRLETQVQKLTDKFIAEIEQCASAKETELMAV